MTLATATPRLSVNPQLVWDSGYELLELSHSLIHYDIWEVRHRRTYEIFAWKQLRPEWEQDVPAQQRFQNEAAVARLVQSPLLPRIVTIHVDESPRYLLYEWFSEQTFEQTIQAFAPLPIHVALWVARQCAQGLDDLLKAGLIHGDLQPENILIRDNGTICLMEFSQSRRVSPQLNSDSPRRPMPTNGPLDDFVAVTASHQPPQGQAKDLHGLGVMLFRALTGHFPFEQPTAAEFVAGVRSDPRSELLRLRPEIDENIANLVGDLLSPAAQRRPIAAAQLVHRLMKLELDRLGGPSEARQV